MANYLFPQGRVVSGDKVALEEVQKAATAAGALKAQMVAVSGAFHTSRMDSAAEALKAVMAEVCDSRAAVCTSQHCCTAC